MNTVNDFTKIYDILNKKPDWRKEAAGKDGVIVYSEFYDYIQHNWTGSPFNADLVSQFFDNFDTEQTGRIGKAGKITNKGALTSDELDIIAKNTELYKYIDTLLDSHDDDFNLLGDYAGSCKSSIKVALQAYVTNNIDDLDESNINSKLTAELPKHFNKAVCTAAKDMILERDWKNEIAKVPLLAGYDYKEDPTFEMIVNAYLNKKVSNKDTQCCTVSNVINDLSKYIENYFSTIGDANFAKGNTFALIEGKGGLEILESGELNYLQGIHSSNVITKDITVPPEYNADGGKLYLEYARLYIKNITDGIEYKDFNNSYGNFIKDLKSAANLDNFKTSNEFERFELAYQTLTECFSNVKIPEGLEVDDGTVVVTSNRLDTSDPELYLNIAELISGIDDNAPLEIALHNNYTMNTQWGLDENGNIVFRDRDYSTNSGILGKASEVYNRLKDKIFSTIPDELIASIGADNLSKLIQAAWITSYNDFNCSDNNIKTKEFITKVFENFNSILESIAIEPSRLEFFTQHTAYADNELLNGLPNYANDDTKYSYRLGSNMKDEWGRGWNDTNACSVINETMKELRNRLREKYKGVLNESTIDTIFKNAYIRSLDIMMYSVSDCPKGTGNGGDFASNLINWDNYSRHKDGDVIYVYELVNLVLYQFDKRIYGAVAKDKIVTTSDEAWESIETYFSDNNLFSSIKNTNAVLETYGYTDKQIIYDTDLIKNYINLIYNSQNSSLIKQCCHLLFEFSRVFDLDFSVYYNVLGIWNGNVLSEDAPEKLNRVQKAVDDLEKNLSELASQCESYEVPNDSTPSAGTGGTTTPGTDGKLYNALADALGDNAFASQILEEVVMDDEYKKFIDDILNKISAGDTSVDNYDKEIIPKIVNYIIKNLSKYIDGMGENLSIGAIKTIYDTKYNEATGSEATEAVQARQNAALVACAAIAAKGYEYEKAVIEIWGTNWQAGIEKATSTAIKNKMTDLFAKVEEIKPEVVVVDKSATIKKNEDVIGLLNTVGKNTPSYYVDDDGEIVFVNFDDHGSVFADSPNVELNAQFRTLKVLIEEQYAAEIESLGLTDQAKANLFNMVLFTVLTDAKTVNSQYDEMEINRIMNSVIDNYSQMIVKISKNDDAMKYINEYQENNLLAGKSLLYRQQGTSGDCSGLEKWYTNRTTYAGSGGDNYISISKTEDESYTYDGKKYENAILKVVSDRNGDDIRINEAMKIMLSDYITQYNDFIPTNRLIELFRKAQQNAFTNIETIKTDEKSKNANHTTVYGYGDREHSVWYDPDHNSNGYNTTDSQETCVFNGEFYNIRVVILNIAYEMEKLIALEMLG